MAVRVGVVWMSGATTSASNTLYSQWASALKGAGFSVVDLRGAGAGTGTPGAFDRSRADVAAFVAGADGVTGDAATYATSLWKAGVPVLTEGANTGAASLPIIAAGKTADGTAIGTIQRVPNPLPGWQALTGPAYGDTTRFLITALPPGAVPLATDQNTGAIVAAAWRTWPDRRWVHLSMYHNITPKFLEATVGWLAHPGAVLLPKAWYFIGGGAVAAGSAGLYAATRHPRGPRYRR